MLAKDDPAGQGVTEEAPITVLAGPEDGVMLIVPRGGTLMKPRIVPESPTAPPWLASTNDTPNRSWVVPEVRVVQVVPPSPVARIVPMPPTAQPWLASTNDTPKRPRVVPEVFPAQ